MVISIGNEDSLNFVGTTNAMKKGEDPGLASILPSAYYIVKMLDLELPEKIHRIHAQLATSIVNVIVNTMQ
jgi:hypothetical protein